VRHKIYVDTHFVDYLWNHRLAIWEENQTSLEQAGVADRSKQVEEYELVRELPLLVWLNEWEVVIGDKVLCELSKVSHVRRRSALVGYAKQIRRLDQVRGDHHPREETPRLVDEHALTRDLALLPLTDQPLVAEAIASSCSIYLTTDRGVLRVASSFREKHGLRIQTLTAFVDEEAEADQLMISLPTGSTAPDIALHTAFVPPDL